MGTLSHHIIDIDTGNITTSIEDELKRLQPLSDRCCIYRVPKVIYRLNEAAYTPQIVSIGPIHYGKPELKAMEDYKRRYLQDFLRLGNANIDIYAGIVKQKETKIRNCYAENIELTSNEFVKMILIDSVFVIMVLLKFSCPKLQNSSDRVFHRPWMENDMRYEMLLLENQIPFFVLEYLYQASGIASKVHGLSLIQMTHSFFKIKWGSWVTEEGLEKKIHLLSRAEHILDFLRICQLPTSKTKRGNFHRTRTPVAWYAPTASDLKQAGIKLKVGSSSNKLDVEFKNGNLYLPTMKITSRTEVFLRSLQAFEQCHCYERYLNDYIALITMLVASEKDVEIATRSGIIHNRLRSKENLSVFFNNLAKGNVVSRNRFYFSDIVEDMNRHCRRSWRKWKASLKNDYFNSPWAVISVFGAFALLLLTVIQTVSSVLQL